MTAATPSPSGQAGAGHAGQAGAGHVELARETRAEAAEVLGDLLGWLLATPRWERVRRLVVTVEAAVAAGDLTALRAATVELELAGPVRATRIGAAPVIPPPAPLAERVDRLRHALAQPPPEQRRSSIDPRTGED